MSPWKLLIVDDEPLARRNLQLALAQHAGWTLTGLAASAAEARVAMTDNPADLVLLDIQMPR
jgi:two-component system LytT family response regulator